MAVWVSPLTEWIEPILMLTREHVLGRPATCDDQNKVILPAQIGVTLEQVFADVQPGESYGKVYVRSMIGYNL